MSVPAKILLIEDDQRAAGALRQVLVEEGYEVAYAARGDAGLESARTERPDVVVTDLRLPGLDGLQLVRQLRLLDPRLPVILMTAHGTTETAIEATKLGAYDYLSKPFEMEELLELVGRAAAGRRLMAKPVALGQETPTPQEALIGASRAMQNLYKEIGRIAASPATVLIRGETGTGKELVARAIYQHSDRAREPFIAVHCAAIPETLLESELFGHERGAFTGAEHRRIGRFEQANGGTLFLDEIGDLPPATQVKLLRVLQERVIQRIGGSEAVPIDVRVLAATHRDLEEAMAGGEFREDLFYRLNVVTLILPALRERLEDIPALVQHFLRRHGGAGAGIQPDALRLLQSQPWPGNVRELENVVRKALLASRGLAITVEDVQRVLDERAARNLPRNLEQPLAAYLAQLLAAASRGEAENILATATEAVERELLAQAIALAGGNKTKAAKWLGITRLTLREKLVAYGLG